MRPPRNIRTVGTGAAVLAILLAGCSRPSAPAAGAKGGESPVASLVDLKGKPAPDFTLADHTGKPVQISSLKGKVVLLNFWATWCGPCKVEIPWFIEFQQTYRDRDFTVLGVSLDDDGWKSVRPYIEEKKINYRIMVGNEEVAKQYGGLESLPSTVILDKNGKVVATHIGLVSKSNYQSEIEQLLNVETKAETRAPASAENRASGNAGGSGERTN